MKNLILLLTLLFVSHQGEAHIGSHNKDLRDSNIEVVYSGKGKIILTFDDGPNPRSTPKVLDTLMKYNIKATFFVLGKLAKQYPQIMRRIEREGHIIANHSYEHGNIAKYSRFKIKRELKKAFFEAHEAIVPYTNNVDRFYFRAPYGAWQSKAAKIVNKTRVGRDYIGPVLWDIGGNIKKNSSGVYTEAADWGCWSQKLTIDECLEGYLNKTDKMKGGVVLLHDIHMKSAQMLDKFIPALLERGYEFITLDEVGLTK